MTPTPNKESRGAEERDKDTALTILGATASDEWIKEIAKALSAARSEGRREVLESGEVKGLVEALKRAEDRLAATDPKGSPFTQRINRDALAAFDALRKREGL